MPRLFSYGTLQLPKVQKETFGRLLVGEVDALVGFRLEKVEIKDPAVLAASGQTFHPIVSRSEDIHDRVEGTLFEIAETELEQADQYEVDDYKREWVTLASGQGAWLYVQALRHPK